MRRTLLVCLLAMMLCSCVSTRAFNAYETKKLESIAEAKEATKKMLDGWLFRSGVIHGALEPIKHEMPLQTLDAMRELDNLALKHQDKGLNDQELGLALGLRLQMAHGIIKKTIELYAPDIVRFLPVTL